MFFCTNIVFSQDYNNLLILKMEAYNKDIQNTYNEYQKIYYEKKSSKSELKAFEDIISGYISQILEIYETISLSKLKNHENARNIAAKSLIFRSLTYLEKAPLNIEFYEKACYDYYQALEMYNNITEIPIILKPLTNTIKVTNKKYSRLIDLIANKGKELYSFGKVKIVLKKFKITSNLNYESLEFVRISSTTNKKKFTYNKAEMLTKNAFKKVLYKNGTTSFFLALPEGVYTIRSKSIINPLYSSLSTIYVRANQQQEYIIEPLLDWIVVYENTKSRLPSFNNEDLYTNATNNSSRFLFWGNNDKDKNEEALKNKINEIVSDNMGKININKIFNLRDPWIKSRFTNLASKVLITYITSNKYFNSWNQWVLSWDIANDITEEFSPGNSVPTELVILVNNVLVEI